MGPIIPDILVYSEKRLCAVRHRLILSLVLLWLLTTEKEDGWYRTFKGRPELAAAC